MASLFSALGTLSAQAGDAKGELDSDRQKAKAMAMTQQFKNRQLSIEESRLGAEQERLALDKKTKAKAEEEKGWDKALTFSGSDGKKKQFNPVTGKFRDMTVPEGFTEDHKQSDRTPEQIIADAQKAMGRPLTDKERAKKLGIGSSDVSPYEVKQDKTGQYIYLPRDPNSGLKPVHTGVFGHTPKGEGSSNGSFFDPDIETLKNSKSIMAMAHKWRDEGIKPPAKYQSMVETVMDDAGWKAKLKLNATEQKQVDLMKQLQPKIESAMEMIEKAKLTDDNSLATRIIREKDWKLYQHGIMPKDKNTRDMIKVAAALQVMGAAPWVQIGRGKYMFETIVQHLPSPTDTPANLYDKLNFLKGIVEDAKASLPEGAFGQQGASTSIDDLLDSVVPRKK